MYAYTKSGSSWALSRTIALNHGGVGIGIGVAANASGLGISADGRTLVVVNNYNESISVVDTASGLVRYEHDLRPYFPGNEGVSGGVGGTFPFAVVVKGNGTAYVSSDRDREVVVIDISSPTAGRLVKRIRLDGNGLGMTLNRSGSRLFVAEDNADEVAVIETGSNKVIAKIDARAPEGVLSGDHDEQRAALHRRRDLRRDAGAGRPDPLRGECRRQLDRRDSAGRRRALVPGARSHPHRLRTSRHHLQQGRRDDVHHQWQERHRAQSRPPGQQHAGHHVLHLSRRQHRGSRCRPGVERVSVPDRARVTGERARSPALAAGCS